MRAAVVEKPNSLIVRDIPKPATGDYDALCKILYGTTCVGTDSHLIDGSFPWMPKLPAVLGHESVGRVTEVGHKVKNFKVGDLITRVGTPPLPDGSISVGWGGFAQWGIARDHAAMADDGLPESQWKEYRVNQIVPDAIDPREAPMFITWRETLSYLLRRGFRREHSLLVLGSGANGLSFARHAFNIGSIRIVMVGSARLAEPARNLAGVSEHLDYRTDDMPSALKALQPEGFDFVIDAIGQTSGPRLGLPCVKHGGHFARYGLDDFANFSIDPTLARGSFTYHGPGDYDEAETHARISEWALQGKLKADLWYDKDAPWPLDRIAEAYASVIRRESVKALISLQDSD